MNTYTTTPEYGWQVVEFRRTGLEREVHVVPAHESDHSPVGCWCAPKVTVADGSCPLVVHSEKN